ncbi:ABC transporter permease [Ligilactobacillus sp. WILCCON 0076]|uniref:Transport permease protein n=1 Tax=Ligilactobacillus ubinensis TaxID=2876789 RepID=A0A9X2FIW2_9LACO|nr:ABC transporter permease [Ligilactobacillus ubinensis]MCP0886577.1 ABC transporter permease [Ligilactobacillus ubinensis]
MKIFLGQLKFDINRIFIRNFSFLFFSLLMPAGFYLLFTKVMITGTGTEVQKFQLTYMGSMIIYSGIISAIFGIASLLKTDRDKGFLCFLQLTPHKTKYYYFSIYMLIILLNLVASIVLQMIAVVFNGVKINFTQVLQCMLIVVIGQLPMVLLGTCLSYLKKQETLNVVSNVIVFPLAIVSGLWWPLSVMPTWLQKIGQVMPTFFANDLLSEVLLGEKLKLTNFIGMIIWIVLGLIGVAVVLRFYRKQELSS